MENTKKVPILRFPEFSGDWEKRTIENEIDFLSGYPFDGKDITEDKNGKNLMRGINITEGYIRHNKDIDKYYLGKIESLQKYLLKENDLVIGMDGSKVGKNSALIRKNDVDTLLVQRVARLRAKKYSSIEFIYQHIISNKFHSYVDKVNTSSGIPHISAKQIKEFEISFPTFPEQQKIADFLTQIDNKINQLSQKKQLLERYKKGVMQQIFSQEIRFTDDDGREFPEWEETSLGKIAKVNPKSSFLPDEFIYIDLESVEKGVLLKETTIFRNEAPSRAQRVLDKGDILFQMVRPYQRNNLFFNKDGSYVASTGYAQIRTNENAQFIYQALQLNSFVDEVMNRCTGTSYPAINSSELAIISIIIPCLKEQTKIANFLTALDEKIALVEKQLHGTKQYKKGLLQQLFV